MLVHLSIYMSINYLLLTTWDGKIGGSYTKSDHWNYRSGFTYRGMVESDASVFTVCPPLYCFPVQKLNYPD
ncbi:hypothetical protein J2W48_002992 [Flavobacterium piscis]|uniref:Uncharacterized protein n=1 Tax=Flavobacterium piscis TaxID=1114874 RepID=A0ABU1Y9X3_9FLAO|nr:hypothetical protein [Flavobacterium piscis]